MRKLFAGAALALASLGSWAVTSTTIQALTYTSYYDGDPRSDYASAGSFSNVNYGGQRGRGFAEFNLAGLSLATFQSANLTFAISSSHQVDSRTYHVDTFRGNNMAAANSRFLPSFATLMSLDLSRVAVGSTFVIDTSLAVAAFIQEGAGSFGITIPELPNDMYYQPNGPAYFGLNGWALNVVTSDVAVSAVPEPSTLAALLILLPAVAVLAGRSRRMGPTGGARLPSDRPWLTAGIVAKRGRNRRAGGARPSGSSGHR